MTIFIFLDNTRRQMILNEMTQNAGCVAHTGEKGKAYRVLVGKPGGKRPTERSRRRWKNNTKMNLCGAVWIIFV
jgi:hypothetical protein